MKAGQAFGRAVKSTGFAIPGTWRQNSLSPSERLMRCTAWPCAASPAATSEKKGLIGPWRKRNRRGPGLGAADDMATGPRTGSDGKASVGDIRRA